jgi:hypothetical protein
MGRVAVDSLLSLITVNFMEGFEEEAFSRVDYKLTYWFCLVDQKS